MQVTQGVRECDGANCVRSRASGACVFRLAARVRLSAGRFVGLIRVCRSLVRVHLTRAYHGGKAAAGDLGKQHV